jgi:outer membrane protein assembly factor BamA
MKTPAWTQATAPSPLDNVSQALQKLLADQQFDKVQVSQSGGTLAITAQKAEFVLMAVVGHAASRKRAVASVGGAIAASR